MVKERVDFLTQKEKKYYGVYPDVDEEMIKKL